MVETHNTGLTLEYGLRREWDDWEMIREFAQNSLDETGTVGIYKKGNDLLISDEGEGFHPIRFLVGHTEKTKCDRGIFGEGMKLACIVAINKGYNLSIQTRGKIITPYIGETIIADRSAKTLHFEIKEISPVKVKGTRIIIGNYGATKPTYEDRIITSSTNKNIVFQRDCYCVIPDEKREVKYKCMIINEENPGVYVKDIYVYTPGSKDEGYLAFSYNIIDVELSADRNIPDLFSLKLRISDLILTIKDRSLIQTYLNIFDAEKSWEANNIRFRYLPKRWKEEVVKKYGDPKDHFVIRNPQLAEKVEYVSGLKGIHSPYALDLVSGEIYQSDTEVIDKLKNVPMPPKKEPDQEEQKFLTVLDRLTQKLYYKVPTLRKKKPPTIYIAKDKDMEQFSFVKEKEKRTTFGRADADKNLIALNADLFSPPTYRLIATFIHELSHITHEIGDKTPELDDAVEQNSAYLVKIVSEPGFDEEIRKKISEIVPS